MVSDQTSLQPAFPPGWIGGFSTSDKHFAYPDPNLSSLTLTKNMDNIGKLTRQVDVWWPEFSWETVIGDPSSRCYQMFAHDISRLGYDDRGQTWSIICPQQGAYSATLGSLNIEVTVTGQRGWMDERANPYTDLLAADMTVLGQIWFGPGARDKLIYKLLKIVLEKENLTFPADKANAIKVILHHVGDANNPIISIRSGPSDAFENPAFATHELEAWGVANVAVGIGPIKSLDNTLVDDFNAMVMAIFNLASGNILTQGNVLTWNVWFSGPTLVDQTEWAQHAEKWRHSIDTGHGPPDGPGTAPRYFDGTSFSPVAAVAEEEWNLIKAFVKKHCPWLLSLAS